MIPVTDINFPSLTFCPNVQLKKIENKVSTTFDYLSFKQKIDDGRIKVKSINEDL
jgi:hypothetical protein